MHDHPTVSVAEIRYKNQTKKVAIYERMSTNEASLLLQAAFFAPSAPEWNRKVVGFVHLKTKTFLPLSLGTAFPQLFQPNHTYELILDKVNVPPTSTPPVESSTKSFRTVQHPVEDAEPWSEKLYGLLVHWNSHNSPGLPLERIETLLGQQHPELHQAYIAYNETQDVDLLVQNVRRILALLMQQTKTSFTRVVAQLPLLQPHDIALIHELFTQGFVSMLYFPYGFDLGNELVLAAWEVYELEEDKDELADTLLRIVRFKRQQAAPSFDSICREMVERGLLTWSQCKGLLRLWEAKNEAIIGAVEAFHVDKDIKELVDTLLLVVKHAGLARVDAGVSEPLSPTKETSLEELNPLSPKSAAKAVSPTASASYGTFTTLTSPSSAFLPQLLDSLLAKKKLTPVQHQLLGVLATRNDPRLASAVSEFKAKQDAEAFVQLAVDLCDVVHWETNHETILQTWIVPLEEQGRGSGLRQLWQQDDPRMMAAYLLFVEDQQEDEFIDTLARLSSVESPVQALDERDDNREIASSLVALHSAGKISQEMLEHLEAEDPKVAAAFDVYESDQNMDELLDTLERIHNGTTKSEDTKATTTSPIKPEDMEKQLLHFVYELDLPAEEIAALKQAIADNDVVVQAAMEVFQVEHDEDDLKDTLRRVARYNAAASESVQA
ncbi:unnamed protein product [Aphanomyces euteiches]